MPIRSVMVSSPVWHGRVATLLDWQPLLRGKQLELLKETVPKLSRVAVFATSTSADYARVLKEIELVAGAFGGKLQHLDVQSPKDIETSFRAAVKGRADGIL